MTVQLLYKRFSRNIKLKYTEHHSDSVVIIKYHMKRLFWTEYIMKFCTESGAHIRRAYFK